MDFYRFISRLLVIFAIVGLVVVPLSRPVMAQASSNASTHAMMDGMSAPATTDEMANDMPCCPSKAPAPIGCDKCIFMAACNAQCFTGLSAAIVQPSFTAAGTVMSLRNESWPDSLGHPPPDQPPRTLI